jgi:hypothetical protein
MHAFVTAILLGMPRLDSFNTDSEAKPPNRQFAYVEQSVSGSERHAMSLRMLAGRPFSYRKIDRRRKSETKYRMAERTNERLI